MLDIVYFSKTRNVKRFIQKTQLGAIQGTADLIASNPFILVMYNTGFGETPSEIEAFLSNPTNQGLCQIICASGNKNWGAMYQQGARKLSVLYQIPIAMEFELSGNIYDVDKFKNIYKEYDEKLRLH